MSSSILESLINSLLQTSYADGFGAGIEMWSRERIFENWDEIQTHLFDRSPPFNVGLNVGDYTDDTEQSLGLARTLLKKEILDFDTFIQDMFDVYDEYKSENSGVPRGGYGGFGSVAKKDDVDRIKLMRDKLNANMSRTKPPGNGAGMRMNPLIFVNRTNREYDTILQTVSTHNHQTAVVASLVQMNVARALVEERILPKDCIQYALKWLNGEGDTTFLSVPKCDKLVKQISAEKEIPVAGDFSESIAHFINRLKIVDTLEEPLDERGSNIDVMRVIIQNAKPCGGTGLSAKADQTIFATLYCWKWMFVDFNRNKSLFDVLLRTISFGGDTDTLAATVYPVATHVIRRKYPNTELPPWLLDALTESKEEIIRRRLVGC